LEPFAATSEYRNMASRQDGFDNAVNAFVFHLVQGGSNIRNRSLNQF
jgi:hypothetical protein